MSGAVSLDAGIGLKPTYHILLNGRSGTAEASGITSLLLRQTFEAAGLEVTIETCRGAFADAVASARRSAADVIVAAGGDGTVTAVAEAMVGSDKPLALLPMGTVNLLARDLGIPLVLDAWVSALPRMQPRRIDVGEVNGHVFLHKVIIGFAPAIAAAREQLRGGRAGLAAVLGFLAYVVRRIFRSRRFALAIEAPGVPVRVVRAQSVAVANNAYDEAPGHFFSRQRLDAGKLTLYVLRHLTLGDVIRLVTRMLLGRWRGDEALMVEEVPAVVLQSKKRSLRVVVDGEIVLLDTPLRFRIRPRALTVLAPPPSPPAG